MFYPWYNLCRANWLGLILINLVSVDRSKMVPFLLKDEDPRIFFRFGSILLSDDYAEGKDELVMMRLRNCIGLTSNNNSKTLK